MRIILFYGCLLYSAVSLPAMASEPEAGAGGPIQKPNMIFIFADDWGYGDLSLRGHPEFKTPHVDQLAAKGTDFQEFTVSAPVCSPSRAAVMTGQYPARHSVHGHFARLRENAGRGMPDWLDPTVTQLPRLLQEAGYDRAYSVGSSGGLRGQKRSLYEGGIRVPFIVRWPGQTPAGRVNTTAVMNAVDLLPTFCEIAGVSLPEGYKPDGVSILPALRGEDWRRSQPIFWEFRGGGRPQMAIRDGDWKLLMNFGGGSGQLYDIPRDPAESRNLAAEHPERAAELRTQLEVWKAFLPENPPAHCLSKFR